MNTITLQTYLNKDIENKFFIALFEAVDVSVYDMIFSPIGNYLPIMVCSQYGERLMYQYKDAEPGLLGGLVATYYNNKWTQELNAVMEAGNETILKVIDGKQKHEINESLTDVNTITTDDGAELPTDGNNNTRTHTNNQNRNGTEKITRRKIDPKALKHLTNVFISDIIDFVSISVL